jgi:UDP-N-acetylmuramate: L-alanyl-gamma-D-glutamyl-meso-diaminopimelate ligase
MSNFKQSSLKNLNANSHVHLMGICGTAMASLAGLLKDRGFKVTGSDSNPYPPMSTQIEAMGIMIAKPYQKENLVDRPDFVVVGNVISANNPEAQEVMALGIPFCSLPQAMGEFIIGDRESYVISGTHGKTTTTSLMSWVAECCQLNPGFLIGGIPKNFNQSFRNPKGDLFIIEGDEYDTAYFDKVPKFIHYRPKNVVLTSVEFDHADIYKDFDAVKSAFVTLMKLIPNNGSLVYWGDDLNVKNISEHCRANKKFSYGFNRENDFVISIVEEKENFCRFKISHENEILIEVQMPLLGRYNILNAASVVVMSSIQDWPIDGVKRGLSTFAGVKRRQEILGEFAGVTLIEDFAHHPTAVRETIKAIQKQFQNRKVFSVFEPRSATSRRKVFQKDYLEAFTGAQEVILADAFDQSKLSDTDRFSSQQLVDDLTAAKTKAFCYTQVDQIVSHLVNESKPSDVILIMSNGGFGGIYKKLSDGLNQKIKGVL